MNGIQKEEKLLFCSTDREIDEFNIPGSWFLPNGSNISRSLHITLGNQIVGLNISPDLPSGIYHCEMMDKENFTHHLYAGIYPEDEGTRCYNNIIATINVIIAKQRAVYDFM